MPFIYCKDIFKQAKIIVDNSYAVTMERKDHEVCSRDSRRKYSNHFEVKIPLFIILILSARVIDCSENATDDDVKRIEKDIPKRLKLVEAIAGKAAIGDIYQNGTFRTGNDLWDDILNECTVKPSMNCLQKNFYSFLDESLEFNGDVNVASGMRFKKNNVDINKYSKEANIIYLTGSKGVDEERGRSLDEENEIDDEEESETPLEEVTDALYNKGVKFLMTHDMKLTLPELFFHGSTLKVSPRALTKTGALVHIDLEPKAEENGVGRIFFLNKIKKFLKKKLVSAALAIILVVKLIALKLVFVLPLILGVTTAKKMFLKLLLFLFPALSHIFKLCSWYHQNYHTTKYHHHHHLITHHHKVPHAHHSAYGYPSHSSGSVLVKPHVENHQPSPYYPQDWELSGPGLGNEYIASDIHRNAIANFKPHLNDGNDINAWGLGMPPGQSSNVGEYGSPSSVVSNAVPSPVYKTNLLANAGRPVGPPNPYQRNKKQSHKDPLQAEKEALLRAAALAARAPPSPVRDELLRISAAKLTETNRVQTETDLVRQQQEILAAQDPDTIAAEKFYGSLLEKVDAILSPIGAADPGCKERAVCALYRDPFKHAPYSNLVSNELSKDSSELVPPADSKMALRYYRYVQAARDGQEQKDCVSLYPNCNIDYNKK